MDEDLIPLTAICPKCGKLDEVGYTFGRARVASSEYQCPHCGHQFQDEAAASPAPAPSPRKGPKPASRRNAHPARFPRAS